MIIDVLVALAVVAAVALLFGILLAVFIKFFGIEEDPRVVQIRECLPGINCGACGFKGCSDYAEAMAAGNAPPNLCIPGAEADAKQIGEILGVKVEKPKDMVAFVHCNGTCEAAPEKAIYSGIDTCRARAMICGGPKVCNWGCLGCGDCAAVCVNDAICMEDGIARINTARCVGCGLCVNECPKHIISMVPQETEAAVFCSSRDKGADARKACKNACIACKKCEKNCPAGAITVKNNCAVIDYNLCTHCGACTDGCPTGCLQMVFFPDLPENFSWN